MHAFSYVIRKRQGHEFYQKFSLHAFSRGTKIPSITEVLGSEYEENKVVFSKEQDEKLLAWQEKRLKEQRGG